MEKNIPPENSPGKKKEGKHAGGRPTKYRPEYCQKIVEFFDVAHCEDKLVARVTGKNDYEKNEYKEIANAPRFFSAFARSINVETSSLKEWAKTYPEFSKALTRAKELQVEMFYSNASKSLYNPHFVAYMFGQFKKTAGDSLLQEELGKPAGAQEGGAEVNRTTIVQVFRSTTPAETDLIQRGGDPLKVLFGEGFDPNSNGHATNGR